MTEFIARNFGNKEFEIIIKTDSKEHYKATEDFARGLIDHAKPKTNADHIREMTDEELAKWLCARFDCYGTKPCPAKHECYPDHNGMLCWLQQPYKENEDG